MQRHKLYTLLEGHPEVINLYFRIYSCLFNFFLDLNFCVFGLGNSLYAENFNSVAKDVDSFFHQLSAQR